MFLFCLALLGLGVEMIVTSDHKAIGAALLIVFGVATLTWGYTLYLKLRMPS